MKKVYILWHIQNKGIIDEQTLKIGVFSSLQLVEEAKNQLKDKPGFIDYPDDFYIDEYIIDQDYCIERD